MDEVQQDPQLHELLNAGVFAKIDTQLIIQAFCILIQKNGGSLDIPLGDIQDFQDKQVDLEWEINNVDKKLTFKVIPVPGIPVSIPMSESGHDG